MRPIGQLKVCMLAYLMRHGSTTDKKAAKFLGVAHQTAYRYLAELCDDGAAHRTRTYNPRGTWLVTFNVGPALEVADAFDSRPVVKTWAPMRVSDPWMLPREFFQGAAP